MRHIARIIAATLFTFVLITGTSAATFLDDYTNITIYDGNSKYTTGWNGVQEDDEVEPGAVTGQSWDLEGFFQNGSSLALVGGFDFAQGVDNIYSGDIFIDITGDAGQGGAENNYGYEYVLDLDFSTMSYDVISLGESASLLGVLYPSTFTTSDPWQYSSGGTDVDGYSDIAFTYLTGLTDSDVAGLSGGTHNGLVVDLSFLASGTDFTVHFTEQCGNDLIMGAGTAPVPEPATMVLFGFGLLGLAGIGRKNLRKIA